VVKIVPWVKFEHIDEHTGKFIFSPLKKGMGTTIGNAMRRILLSSLAGTAVTAIRIEGVDHEFSTIPNVLEDVLDIICNIKGIIFKSNITQPKKMRLEFTGKGKVYAKDITPDSELEVVNKDCYIAELTDKGKLIIELTVERGVGYSPSESNVKEDQAINVLNIDASFSPVLRINHSIESVRVGKSLDYETLILEVWTNESIKVDDAIKEAAAILIKHLDFFGFLNQKPETDNSEEEAREIKERKASALALSIEDLELSARSLNCLKRAGIETVAQLIEKDIIELIKIKNFGKKSADEINDKLKQFSLCLKGCEGMDGLVDVIEEAGEGDEE
jgi:DNA-directed RNA polymerase subunit alpha